MLCWIICRLLFRLGIDLLISLVEALPIIIVEIVKAIPTIITSIIDAVVGNIDKIILAGVQLFVSLIENLPKIIIEIVKAIPKIIGAIVDAMGSYYKKMGEIGLNLVKGIWKWNNDASAWLWEKISGFFGGITDKIKDFFGIHSPSAVFRDMIGKNLALGLGEGFTKEMNGISDDMINAVPTNFDVEGSYSFPGSAIGSAATPYALNFNLPIYLDGVLNSTQTFSISSEVVRAMTGKMISIGGGGGPLTLGPLHLKIYSDDLNIIVKSVNRQLFPNVTRFTQSIPGLDGVIDYGGDTYGLKTNKRIVQYNIITKYNMANLMEQSEKVGAWLYNDGLYHDLIFDDQPTRTYKAKMATKVDVAPGAGFSVTFFCNPPWPYVNGVPLAPADILWTTAEKRR